jgi:nucleoside-diphosphate-sugar epimerase
MEIEEDVKPLFDLGWKPKISIEDGIKLIIKEAIQ